MIKDCLILHEIPVFADIGSKQQVGLPGNIWTGSGRSKLLMHMYRICNAGRGYTSLRARFPLLKNTRFLHEPPSLVSHLCRHAPPFHHTSRVSNPERITSPPHSEYKPPSPSAFYDSSPNAVGQPYHLGGVAERAERATAQARTCKGTATSDATSAHAPRIVLFAAKADDDRPAFASTMYASVQE